MIARLVFLLFSLILAGSITTQAQIRPSRNRISIDISQPQDSTYPYDSLVQQCKAIGMSQTGIFIPWNTLGAGFRQL